MTGSAWDAYRRVSDGFRVPRPSGAAWRRDVVLASGLTALAAEAAMRDIALTREEAPGLVVIDPGRLERSAIEGAPGRILGCSYSCRSSEVLDGLERLRANAVACDLHGNGIAADLWIPDGLVERPFCHVAFCATVPILTDTIVRASQCSLPPVAPFLCNVAARDTVPLFVASGDGFIMRVLHAYWLEYVRRPGFLLHFPEFSHDFLWAIARTSAAPYAFLLERPPADLSDRRFEHVCNLLFAARAPVLIVDRQDRLEAGVHIGLLLSIADAISGLAESLHQDLSVELVHDAGGAVESR